MQFIRESYVYVGVDVHKRTHTGVVVDSYGEQIGKPLKVDNDQSKFAGWVQQIEQRAADKSIMFGLEDVHGLGRTLAKYLLGTGHMVKFVNAYLTKAERDNVNKTDKLDALAVARITAKWNAKLPDADIDPLQWALMTTVSHRKGLVEEQTRVKNRLHFRLLDSWPAYAGFFSEPFESKTALAFWEKYPSCYRAAGVTVAELGHFFRELSHYAMGEKKAVAILATVDHSESEPPFQFERDSLIRSAVRELRAIQQEIAESDEQLRRLVAQTDYDFSAIAGVDVVIAAETIALVGNVTRFKNVDKFLSYTGIAPVVQSTGDTSNRFRSQFGRRELLTLFHRIAVYQLVVHKKTGTARNPEAKAYYEKVLGDQAGLPANKRDRKVVKKALLSLMRQQAKRFYRLMKAQKQAAMAGQAGATGEAKNAPTAA